MPIEIRIDFDPEDPDFEDENLKQIFKTGGPILRLWALYKKGHLTDQHFVPGLLKVQEEINDRIKEGEEPYDFGWFYTKILQHAFGDFGPNGFKKWLLEHWDYFNPNIQRRIVFLYDKVETVQKQLKV